MTSNRRLEKDIRLKTRTLLLSHLEATHLYTCKKITWLDIHTSWVQHSISIERRDLFLLYRPCLYKHHCFILNTCFSRLRSMNSLSSVCSPFTCPDGTNLSVLCDTSALHHWATVSVVSILGTEFHQPFLSILDYYQYIVGYWLLSKWVYLYVCVYVG